MSGGPWGGSIGPRLPSFDAENCECGGVLVLNGHEMARVKLADGSVIDDPEGRTYSVWQCGMCNTIKYGPPARGSTQVITRKDIMPDDDIIV